MRQVQLQEEAVSRYISTHHMDRSGWRTDFEIMLLASLLTIQIFSFSNHGESRQWVCYAPGFTRNRSACPYGIYVYYVHHSRHLAVSQSLPHNIGFSWDTKSMCVYLRNPVKLFGTTWSECTTSCWHNLWCKVILYYQFFSIDVGVSAELHFYTT